jgi:hypothetical protein
MAIPPKNSTHGWSVAIFEEYRNPLTNFLKTRILPLLDANECRRILIRAPVKSGKREMVEYLAMRDHAHCPHRVHVFISAFHRMADEEQRKELRIHNMEVFSIIKKANVDSTVQWINKQIATGKQVVLHIDECDFGAGEKQNLAKVYKQFRVSPYVTNILYSATPQEVLFSDEVEDDEFDMLNDISQTGEHVEYTPPETFRGPASFLDAGLIFEAKPFFYKNGTNITLTEQGKEIVKGLYDQVTMRTGRNICVLRLSYCDLGGSRTQRKENKAIYQFLQGWQSIPELQGSVIIVDKGEADTPVADGILREKINWSDRTYWLTKSKEIPIIIVIDQTSSRSTEWVCHDRIFAYHDFRNTVIFSTISQAQERVNHYTTRYGSFQPIKVYGHKKSFLLSAGRISYIEYMHLEWEARKVDHRVAQTDSPVYKIRTTSPPHIPHPDYPRPLSKIDADRALQELGCFADVKVSARVAGTIRQEPIYNAIFHPCNKDNFTTIIPQLHEQAGVMRNFQNPFINSENQGLENNKYKGYLRCWRVMDFENDIKTQPGWGININEPRVTICYRGEELGIALRYDTGDVRSVNTLETRRSMYKH